MITEAWVSTQKRSISSSELTGHQVELPQRWLRVEQRALQSPSPHAAVPGQIQDLHQRHAAESFTCADEALR